MKVKLLRAKNWKRFLQNGSLIISSCLPFYKSSSGRMAHRPRSGSVHVVDGKVSHWGMTMWCGQVGWISPRRENMLLENVPDYMPVCATCEGRAIGAGQLGSQEINGRNVLFSPRK